MRPLARLPLAFLLQVLLVIHQLDGTEMAVNPKAITTIGAPGTTLTQEAQCLITLVGEKFVTTKEDCEEVLQLMAKLSTGGWLDGK